MAGLKSTLDSLDFFNSLNTLDSLDSLDSRICDETSHSFLSMLVDADVDV